MPKYFRNTRLKCEELENPHENATSVIVFPLWLSSSCRQWFSLACQKSVQQLFLAGTAFL